MLFRYARHTQNLGKLIYFYTSVLEFEVIGKFEDHNGYDGVFLGKAGETGIWNLPKTRICRSLSLMMTTSWSSIRKPWKSSKKSWLILTITKFLF